MRQSMQRHGKEWMTQERTWISAELVALIQRLPTVASSSPYESPSQSILTSRKREVKELTSSPPRDQKTASHPLKRSKHGRRKKLKNRRNLKLQKSVTRNSIRPLRSTRGAVKCSEKTVLVQTRWSIELTPRRSISATYLVKMMNKVAIWNTKEMRLQKLEEQIRANNQRSEGHIVSTQMMN